MKCQHCKREDIPLIINSRRVNQQGNTLIAYMCRECNTARMRKYKSTPEGKAKLYAAVKKSMRKHWDKQLARVALNYRVRKGHIIRPSHCSQCLQEKPVEGHHTDYTKPLEVVWVCRQCHSDLERVVHINDLRITV